MLFDRSGESASKMGAVSKCGAACARRHRAARSGLHAVRSATTSRRAILPGGTGDGVAVEIRFGMQVDPGSRGRERRLLRQDDPEVAGLGKPDDQMIARVRNLVALQFSRAPQAQVAQGLSVVIGAMLAPEDQCASMGLPGQDVSRFQAIGDSRAQGLEAPASSRTDLSAGSRRPSETILASSRSCVTCPGGAGSTRTSVSASVSTRLAGASGLIHSFDAIS